MSLTIPVNRKRFPIVLVWSVVSICAFTSLLIHPDYAFGDTILNVLLCSVMIILFSFYTLITLIEYIKTLFNKNAVLKISETGIYDNLSIFSCGEIPWSDIEAVGIIKLSALNADFLIIKMRDNAKYLTGKNFVKKYVLKRWIKKWGGPVVISEKRIDYNLQKLKDTILNLSK